MPSAETPTRTMPRCGRPLNRLISKNYAKRPMRSKAPARISEHLLSPNGRDDSKSSPNREPSRATCCLNSNMNSRVLELKSKPPPNQKPTMNILIVDDDPTSRIVLEAMLTSLGHQVTACENGAR